LLPEIALLGAHRHERQPVARASHEKLWQLRASTFLIAVELHNVPVRQMQKLKCAGSFQRKEITISDGPC